MNQHVIDIGREEKIGIYCRIATTCKQVGTRKKYMYLMGVEIAQRSPAQVQRMERRIGA